MCVVLKNNLFIFLFFILPSCSNSNTGEQPGKYNLITRDWELESYIYNGTDATASLFVDKVFNEFRRDGVHDFSFLGSDGIQHTQEVPWILDSNEEVLIFSNFESIADFGEFLPELVLEKVKILIITESRFHYSFQSDGFHEFHFIAVSDDSLY